MILLGAGAIILNLDYSTVWRYFSFSNQTLAMIVLWAETVYLLNNKKNYLITLIPAVFMTAVTSTYFLVAKECLGMIGIPYNVGLICGLIITICALGYFMFYKTKKA